MASEIRLTTAMVRRMVLDGEVKPDWAAAWLDGHSCGTWEQRTYQRGIRRIQNIVVWVILLIVTMRWLR